MSHRHHITNESAIFSLWLNWTMAVGSLALPEFAGLMLPKTWIPFVIFGLIILLTLYRRSSITASDSTSCDLIQMICQRALGVSAIIMLVIAVAYARGFIEIFYPEEVLNLHIPYLTILILGPSASVMCMVAMFKGYNSDVCRRCIIKHGNASERGFLGKIFLQESRYQVRLLFVLSTALSVAGWLYYWYLYVNVNLNLTDLFVFNWVPVIFYALSIIYLGMRYFTLWGYYYNHIELNPRNNTATTTIRYLILCGDDIFLNRNDDGFSDIPDENKYDTPAGMCLPFRNRLDLSEADHVFNDISGLSDSDYSMRFMYKSSDVSGLSNIYHYICCVKDRTVLDGATLTGRWFTLSQLQRLLYNHDLSPMLATEIHRLYTVTMAWKTYSSDGRRLYKIKNYRPSFRLNGICDWDVDFNNPQWLEVARFNEDKPFFRLRRLLQHGRGHSDRLIES